MPGSGPDVKLDWELLAWILWTLKADGFKDVEYIPDPT
jgi:hypothetical protein